MNQAIYTEQLKEVAKRIDKVAELEGQLLVLLNVKYAGTGHIRRMKPNDFTGSNYTRERKK